MLIRLGLLALLALATLTGCGSTAVASQAPVATPTATPSPNPATVEPAADPSADTGDGTDDADDGRGAPEGDLLTGELGADAVEGGCAYLLTEDRTRFEVIYPDGWTIRADPLELRSPDGEVVATGGETITLSGEEAREVGSICMIGPIFRAAEVVSIEE